MASGLCRLPAHEMARRVAARELSAEDLLDAFVDRINRLNPKINAYCTTTFELAREAARRADQVARDLERDGGDAPRPPLLGVPTSVKDLVLTGGVRTTFGSKLFEDHVPERDEVVVQRLKAAGAVILGKTNTSEFGHVAVTDNLVFGRTNNPWNLALTAGGSSGGAAAACAAMLAPVNLGSDGGGSVRIPSAFCGVLGFKPSFGRIPIAPAFGAGFWGLNHYGPITRDVLDAALAYDATRGPHPGDRTSLPLERGPGGRSAFQALSEGELPDRLKLAYWPDLGFVKAVDPEVEAVVEAAARKFEQLGWTVERVKKRVRNPEGAFSYWVSATLAADFAKYLKSRREEMVPSFATFVEAGVSVTGLDLVRALQRRETLHDQFLSVLTDHDLLITPTTAIPAFEGDLSKPYVDVVAGKGVSHVGWMPFTYPFNMTGMPAASVPAGFTRDGLPVGMQLAGPPRGDLKVLQAALAFERVAPWKDHLPPGFA
ncbi:MAG: amidase [Promethearchaeota archaeon]